MDIQPMNDGYVWLLMRRTGVVLEVLCVYGSEHDAIEGRLGCLDDSMTGENYFIDRRPVW